MISQPILLYVLKSTFISGILLTYYWIALRNKSFHSYNRFYLLLSMVCSLVIPFFNFNWFSIEQQDLPVPNETLQFISTRITAAHSTAFTWQDIVFPATIGISLFLLIVLTYNIIKVYQLKRRSAIVKMEGVDFIYTDLDQAPFSFLNNLFWKESISLDSTYGKKIFKHEITHIRQKHTIDNVFCQLVNAIFWMNPFNWLIQKELRAIHEFIADQEAVGNNNVEDFVRLLLQAHYGNHFFDPTQPFYYSSIKRRLSMLTTTGKTTFSTLRKFLVLPVTLLVVGMLSVSTIESKANAIIAPIITTPQQQITSVQQPEIVKPAPAHHRKKRLIKNDTLPGSKKVNIKTEGMEVSAEMETSENNQHITIRANKVILSTKYTDSLRAKLPPVTYYINNELASIEDVGKLKPENIKSI
ncbi:MAG TPA: M56 family metallopeptidase, partial [Niastella sp.]